MKTAHLIRASITVIALAMPALAQDNTQVCHTPIVTKASTAKAVMNEGYGKVNFKVTTGSAEAQAFFNQGLALLHSFWAYEADKSFERAAQLDPECAMAQWGIAMAAVNDVRRDQAIKRTKELLAKASDHEKLYISAVEARYLGEKTNVQNNGFLGASEPYKQALRKIVALYPQDNEARLFLALALMSGYERDGTPRPGTIEAVSLLQNVLAKDSNHLAAHHYMIHATESGRRPQDGVPSADVYGSLAPKVGHAVHMPGHTYVHVDRWDDAARAFEGSAEVDRAYIRDNKETTDHAAGPYGHNVHFLSMVYGYQGRYRDALKAGLELLDATNKPGEEKSRTAFEGRISVMRTLVRFEKWDEILNGTLPNEGEFETFKAWRYYAEALAKAGKGDLAGARTQLDLLEREIAWVKDRFSKLKDIPQAARQKLQMRALDVTPYDIRSRILAREGKAEDALAMVRKAIEEEVKLGYSEPPLYPVPMEEVAGKLAVELKRWAEAEEFFQAALDRDPGSGRAYLGLMQAQQGLGKDAAARDSYAKFVKAWSKADTDLTRK
jgi:tetratricopeptide (TPR) repeat protein